MLYEAPHRMRRTLTDIAGAGMGDRRLSAGRELTKLHEEFIRTTVEDLASRYAEESPRGEYVLVIEGFDSYAERALPGPGQPGDAPNGFSDLANARTAELLANGLPVKEIARTVALETGMMRKEAYALALSLKGKDREPI